MAKDFKICIVSLAQLSREAVKHDKPLVSDLRDSGSIEADSDAIFLLNPPSVEDKYNDNKLEVILAKNRHGPTGNFILNFDKATAKMSDFDIKEDVKKANAEFNIYQN